MPAPAVYVLAIVGTVGAVIAFKEFVYEPHIAPAIDRWYLEFQAARRRRQRQPAAVSAVYESNDDVPMSQTTRNIQKPVSKAKFSDGTDPSSFSSDDDEASTSGGNGNRLMKGGLLLRRPPEQRGYERLHDSTPSTPPHPPVIELDDLVAREVREWRNGASEASFPSQRLRQRKNANATVAEHAMDESIHTIPYTPMSPSRTHVLFDSSSSPISTPSSSGSRASSPPLPPLPGQFSPPPTQPLPHHLSFSMTTGDANNTDLPLSQASPAPAPSPLPARGLPPLSPLATTIPSPRFGSPFQQSIEQSPLFNKFLPPASTQTTLYFPTPSTITYPVTSSPWPSPAAAAESPLSSSPKPLPQSPQSPFQPQPNLQTSAIISSGSLQYSQSIPSLSQSYPQELEYEHGLELLSPPSSRSMSPFSMAGLSPSLGSGSPRGNGGRWNNGQGQGLRVLSPSSTVSSAFSSVLSSPALGGTGRSPLAMELGNESFDAISPQVGQVGPAPAPATQGRSVSVSDMSSARSTEYLSFDDNDDDQSSASESGNLVWHPRLPAVPQPFRNSGLGSLLFMDDSMTMSGQTQTPTQESVLTPHASISRVMSSASPRSSLATTSRPPGSGSASPQPSHSQHSQAQGQVQSPPQPQLRSPEHDSLSDLDFLSESSPSEFEFEYAMSEPSDLGNESASESFGDAGPGSDAGRSESGRSEGDGSDGWSMPGAPPTAGSLRGDDHMATIRGGGRFGWSSR